MRATARQTLAHPDSFIAERILFGRQHKINLLQKELFDIIKEWLQQHAVDPTWKERILTIQYPKDAKTTDLFSWPPDPENDIALKTYLELLGWKMTADASGEQIVVRVDFGTNAI